MLKFRLIRGGKQNNPFYKIGILDAKTKRNGQPLQILGFYNPIKKIIKLNIYILLKNLKTGVKLTYRLWILLLKLKICKNIK